MQQSNDESSTGTSSFLYEVIEWTKQHGDVCAVERLNLLTIESLLNEKKGKLLLNELTSVTSCSEECLTAILDAVDTIMKQRSP